jgi:hypothetical protein
LKIPLFCFVDSEQEILFRHFVSHYKKLGVTEFHFTVDLSSNPNFKNVCLNEFREDEIHFEFVSKYHSDFKRDKVNDFLSSCCEEDIEWLLYVDLDEFLNLEKSFLGEEKFESLSSLFLFLDQQNLDALRCYMADKVALDGTFKPLTINQPINLQFPLYNLNLSSELYGVPARLDKISILRPTTRFTSSHDIKGRLTMNDNFIGVLDHYKWDSSIKKRIEKRVSIYKQCKDADSVGRHELYEHFLKLLNGTSLVSGSNSELNFNKIFLDLNKT